MQASFIENIEDLQVNLSTIESYIGCVDSSPEREFALRLIQRGVDFVPYKIRDELHFAPSRFVGYKFNSRDFHIKNYSKDGRKTTPQIKKILKEKPNPNSELEEAYIRYCKQLGVHPTKKKRKYWLFDLPNTNLDESSNVYESEYKEGTIFEGKHKRRERNRSLVKAAILKFKNEHHGNIFCEICGFNFWETYGKQYIEVHHLKPIAEMKENEATSLDDVCMVCSNCHRIIHSKYPCLTISEVTELIRINRVRAINEISS